MTSSTGHFHGRHYRGYMRSVREIKRQEAQERNAVTPKERSKRYRTDPAYQLVVCLTRPA